MSSYNQDNVPDKDKTPRVRQTDNRKIYLVTKAPKWQKGDWGNRQTRQT